MAPREDPDGRDRIGERWPCPPRTGPCTSSAISRSAAKPSHRHLLHRLARCVAVVDRRGGLWSVGAGQPFDPAGTPPWPPARDAPRPVIPSAPPVATRPAEIAIGGTTCPERESAAPLRSSGTKRASIGRRRESLVENKGGCPMAPASHSRNKMSGVRKQTAAPPGITLVPETVQVGVTAWRSWPTGSVRPAFLAFRDQRFGHEWPVICLASMVHATVGIRACGYLGPGDGLPGSHGPSEDIVEQ